MLSFQQWKASVIGHRVDVDHTFGDQCVDVAMSYVQNLFGKPWQQILGYGNAKDLYNASSSSYFTKVLNNHANASQVPPQGAVVVFGVTKTNPYGHIGVVDSASSRGINLIQQDGFNPSGICFEAFRLWTASPCIGWLIPRVSMSAKVVQKVAPKPPAPVPTYIVHQNDTLTAIAARFHTTVAALVKINIIADPNKIKIGQVLKLR